MKMRTIGWLVILCAVWWSCDPGKGDTRNEGSTRTDSTRTDSIRAGGIDTTGADSTAGKLEAVPVETALVETGTISSYLLFNSTVETEAAVEIYPQISGLVERVAVEEGDRVEFGDTLVCLDDDQLQIAVREASAYLKHLQAGFERTRELFRRKLISNQEYENKLYELEQARLRCEQAELELEHAIIRAPFSGVITERYVQAGARVGAGTRLFELIKLDDLIARVFVPGQYLTQVREGQEAVVTSDFLEGRRFQGWVKRISPVVDPKSGTFKVTVGLKDRWEYLRPGIFVEVRIITDTHEEAVLVPKQAVVYDGGDRYVFVVQDGTARKVRLAAGYENSEFVEATSGIQPGMPVIVVGQNGLRDKARVRIVNQPDAEPASRAGTADSLQG